MSVRVVGSKVVVKTTNTVVRVKVFQGLQGRSLNNRGDWVTATAYGVLDFFRDAAGNKLYSVLVAHTSTSVAADLAAGKLIEMLNIAQIETLRDEAAASALTATGKAGEALGSANAAEVSNLASGASAGASEVSRLASEAAAGASEAARVLSVDQADIATAQAVIATAQAVIATNKAAEAAASAASITPVADQIHAAASKTIPNNADELAAADSAAEFGLKKYSWANIKAALKTYFDTIYGKSYNADGLTHIYHPTLDGGFRDLYRSGWLPSWFNQQWGGSQWGGLPDGSFGSVATGNVQDSGNNFVGDSAGTFWVSQGFKLSEAETNPTFLVKLYKVGNPTSVSLYVYSDTAGSPNAIIGTVSTLNGKLITSKTDGEWFAFSPAVGTLAANTQYHLALSTGATDASNHIAIRTTGSSKYPFGYLNNGTSTPVWTPISTKAMCFLIQNPTTNSLLQSGGMFDYKLAFNPGNPWNQSRSVAQPLSNFFDGKEFSFIHRGTYAVSSNVADFLYGLDHDRITLTVNASGYPVLSIYESDRTLHQITGTGSVTTGNHDVEGVIRMVGDGADYATLYVDGVSVGTPLTAQTFTMDKNMRELGTARLGDGFGLVPTWTQDMQMTSLPSAQGWTWIGAATESAAMSIQGGKLYQNANGYTSLQDGYYLKTTTFNNATGWAFATKFRVNADGNLLTAFSVTVDLRDGTKRCTLSVHEHLLTVGYIGTVQFIVQGDFKSSEHTFLLQGKGSDYYLFIDGKLAVDGTGMLVSASANNHIAFGDYDTVAGGNADAIWSYVKYYQGGMLLPIANAGSCSEFVHWSGDKSDLFAPLWTAGSPVSVKQLCGVEKNYIGEGVVQKEVRKGVSSSFTTSSTSPVLIQDMETYILGGELDSSFDVTSLSATTSGVVTRFLTYIEGAAKNEQFYSTDSAAQSYVPITGHVDIESYVGLHKAEVKMYPSSAVTVGGAGNNRQFIVEAKS